jgi:peptide/nickel transport system substrate-binding protein
MKTVALFLLAAVLLAACGGAQPNAAPTGPAGPAGVTTAAGAATAAPAAPTKGGTLTVGLDSEPPTMDPHASPSAITFYISASMGESLLYLTGDRQFKPWLADSWEVTDGGKTFTFKLRKDVKFQDGTPFNAAAVKWNLDRIVDPKYKAGSALGYLQGYDSTEVVDDSTARVKFKSANAPFLTYAASPVLMFVSPTATQAQGDKVNQAPVMSGPFKIDGWVSKQSLTISRWDGYTRRAASADHDGASYLDKIIFKFIPEDGTRMATLESSETQMAATIPSQDLARLSASKDYTIVSKPWTGLPRIWSLNVTKPPTDDVKVRQAINYSVDKDAIVNTIFKGIGSKAFAPLTAAMMDEPALRAYYPFDQAKAKALLDQAGWNTVASDGIRTKGGQRLEIVLNSIDRGAGPDQINVLVQGQLRAVGMDVKLKTQARAPWYEDNYSCATNGPILFLRDGDLNGLNAFFNSSQVGSNFNFSCIKDPAIDKALDAGRAESDPVKRKAIYLALQTQLLDQALTVPLVDEFNVFAMRSTVSGLKFDGFTYPVFIDVAMQK